MPDDVFAYTAETQKAVDRARQQSIGTMLHRTARRFPDKIGIIAGERRVTFAEFDAAVNRCAAALSDAGLAQGERLALVCHNSWQFGVLNFATARLGVILVPINFMLGAEEIAFILEHSGSRAVVTEDALAGNVQKAIEIAGIDAPVRGWVNLGGTPASDGWTDVDTWIDGEGDPGPPDVVVDDEDPLRLMYTSGTESKPKGVLLPSSSLITQYLSMIIDAGMGPDDVEIHSLPMYHCAQLDCFFNVDVYLGATSIILPTPDAGTILQTIEREKVTKLFCPPTVWISLLRHPGFDGTDLSSLQKGYYGAAAMPVEVMRELSERLPDVRFWNLYGQTEMAPLATLLHPHEQLDHPGSAGRAALNVETKIVDDEDAELPRGEVGEIVHRSPHAMLGYYKDEEKTAAVFAGGWFHSGDLGIMDEDGYLAVVDRKKDMIKTGGENVASREVEESLYLLDGVAEVAVFGISHPHWIEAVTAVVVPKDGVTLTEDDVNAHAKEKLAGYKRPKYVVFAEELPKNPSGKILKRELREQHADLASKE